MTNLQDKLKYYLGTGLRFGRSGMDFKYEMHGIMNEFLSEKGVWLKSAMDRLNHERWQFNPDNPNDNLHPIMFRLDAITRPIKVEGEAVVIESLLSGQFATYGSNYENGVKLKRYKTQGILCLSFEDLEILTKYHVWPFDQSLFETGEILDKEKI
ncbi:MAG: hypothetical protein HRU26_00920 [Psychroserpens sp.]|nr:hypothetical protein [Psychroserpens sp.]